ncbi:MAG TPA: GNAT family N-acetyltransferase [Candidatus Binatia bacterium]|nr:GNAT family N-acetyltransferase [Candidatus Binatia bacterium]
MSAKRSPEMPIIRYAIASDLPRLTEIYNHYVRETAITFDVDEYTVEARRRWFEQHAGTGRHQLVVAEVDGRVVGYAGTGTFRAKRAYDTSVEMTIYVAKDATGGGIGTALYRDLFARLAKEDVHRALAGITLPNPASLALHARFGFRQVAHFTENGRKFGRYWDVVWLEKEI